MAHRCVLDGCSQVNEWAVWAFSAQPKRRANWGSEGQATLTFSRKCGKETENAKVGFMPGDPHPEFLSPFHAS